MTTEEFLSALPAPEADRATVTLPTYAAQADALRLAAEGLVEGVVIFPTPHLVAFKGRLTQRGADYLAWLQQQAPA